MYQAYATNRCINNALLFEFSVGWMRSLFDIKENYFLASLFVHLFSLETSQSFNLFLKSYRGYIS